MLKRHWKKVLIQRKIKRDAHSYEPTQKDILSASKSDLFMYTGDNLDPVAKKVASTIKDKDKKLSLEDKLDKAKLLTDQHEHGEEHEHEGHDHEKEEHHHHGGYDPHVWLDPKINQTFAKEIKDELVRKIQNIKMTMRKTTKN